LIEVVPVSPITKTHQLLARAEPDITFTSIPR
jgi:hypothetical protein